MYLYLNKIKAKYRYYKHQAFSLYLVEFMPKKLYDNFS